MVLGHHRQIWFFLDQVAGNCPSQSPHQPGSRDGFVPKNDEKNDESTSTKQ